MEGKRVPVDHTCKIVVVGDVLVGKTICIQKYFNKFDEQETTMVTLGVDLRSQRLTICNKITKM